MRRTLWIAALVLLLTFSTVSLHTQVPSGAKLFPGAAFDCGPGCEVFFGSLYSQAIHFVTANTDRMTISSTGVVSVGSDPLPPTGANTLELYTSTNRPFLNFRTGAADGDAVAAGNIEWNFPANTAATGANGLRIVGISATTQGTTANNRGGSLAFFTKADGGTGTIITRLTINNAGLVILPQAGTLAWDNGSGTADVLLSRQAAGSLNLQQTASIGVGLNFTVDKSLQINDRAQATGMELNLGTPTLGTCTNGTLTSGSHNFAGQYTGNTSSSCIINFGTPNFVNTPYCFAMSTASTTHPRISAASASSITIAGGVSGEAIQYFCMGRIGT